MEKRCLCGSCILIEKGRTLLLFHKKLEKWMYPGGHVDEGELPHECAIRETMEETGIEAELLNPYGRGWKKIDDSDAIDLPIPLSVIYETVKYSVGIHMHFDMVYLGRPSGLKKGIGDGESQDLEWFKEDEIDSLDTFSNVKLVIHRAFEVEYRNFK